MYAMDRSYFEDVTAYRDYIILRILADAERPLGSWVLKEKLDQFEIEISIASIGRFLKNLDHKGFTVLTKNQGRNISQVGIAYLNSIEENIGRFIIEKEVIDASTPNTKKEFLDLLYVRKILEIETARLAAFYATEKDIEMLELAVKEHYKHVAENDEDCTEIGCKFHELVGEASHNRFLYTTLKLLIYEEIEIEKKLPYPSTTSQGRHYIQEHEKIIAAIKDRDQERVVRIMEEHMTKLIEEYQAYFKDDVQD